MQLTYPPITQLGTLGPTIPANAAGLTVDNAGTNLRRFYYRITVTFANAAYIAAALTVDITLITIPARTRFCGLICDTTVAYAGTGITGTIQVSAGKTVGGVEYMLAYDAKTAAVTKGLVNGDLGAAIATSATTPVQGGDIPSWTGTTAINFRLASSVGNIGTGAATNLTQGSTTFVLSLEVLP